MTTAAAAVTPPGRRAGGGFGRWINALLVAGATAALIALAVGTAPRDWPGEPYVDLTLAGEHYRVSPQALPDLATITATQLAAGEQAMLDAIEARTARELDAIFADAKARIPPFVDEYYTLRGEYTRLAAAAMALAHPEAADRVAQRAAERLFPQQAWAAGLERLDDALAAVRAESSAATRDRWITEIAARLDGAQIPAPLDWPGRSKGQPAIELDALNTLISTESARLDRRIAASSVAGAGVALAAPWVARAAAAGGRAAAQGGRAAAGRTGARLAARGASRVGAAAAGGAALCSPGGPIAAGCAIVAGVGAWLATDWALVEIDERLNRDAFERDLAAALDEMRSVLEAQIVAAYREAVALERESAEAVIERTFVPARAGR